MCNGRWRQYRCHADAQYHALHQTFLPVPRCPAVALPTLPVALHRTFLLSTPSLLPSCCHISSLLELTATHLYCRDQLFQNFSYFYGQIFKDVLFQGSFQKKTQKNWNPTYGNLKQSTMYRIPRFREIYVHLCRPTMF